METLKTKILKRHNPFKLLVEFVMDSVRSLKLGKFTTQEFESYPTVFQVEYLGANKVVKIGILLRIES